MDIHLYSIKTAYIDFLRCDPRLRQVFDNKDVIGSFGRKYLGAVLTINDFKYYVPLSSPKLTDYDGYGNIRKDLIPIIRIISPDIYGIPELKGTLKFSSMIPVPDSEITPYIIANETDANYKILVEKEYDFIKSNKDRIMNNALVLYSQKIKGDAFYIGKFKPNYLNSTIDFSYAEEKCILFMRSMC